MAPRKRRPQREQGSIDELPSGALRIRVYADQDLLTGKRHNLVETVPAGPKAWKEAEAVRRRLLTAVHERRNPRTSATVDQLLDRYLDEHQGGARTVSGYREYVDKHVRPFIGGRRSATSTPTSSTPSTPSCSGAATTAPTGRASTTARPGPTSATDAAAASRWETRRSRKIHYILSGAFKRAVRWRWIATSPISQAEPPSVPPPDPQPPTLDEVGRLTAKAFRLDPD